MRIRELQNDVREFSKSKAFHESSIETRALFLVTEIREIVKELLKLDKMPDQRERIKEDIGLEIYDAVWNLMDLANKLDIDLEQAFEKKIEINNTRNW